MSTDTEAEALGWCVVADVAGIKHFNPRARLWVLPPRQADGSDRLLAVGHHHGRDRRLIRIAIPRRHLARFRVRMIYNRAVLRAIERPAANQPPALWQSRAEAQRQADRWNQRMHG
jgi:hypothetical protein